MDSSHKTESAVYSVEEAAEMLDIARNTAYDRVRDGTIPSLRLGRRIVVPRASLDKMLGRGAA